MGSKPHAKSNVQSQGAIQETETEKHDRARRAVTEHLRSELRKSHPLSFVQWFELSGIIGKNGIAVKDKIQWRGMLNILYKNRLTLKGWSSKHYVGAHGGKREYIGTGITIKKLSMKHVLEIFEKLGMEEELYIDPWDPGKSYLWAC